MALSDADKLSRTRRFYREVATGEVDGGYGVLLDGRPAKTPGGTRLTAPTRALAALLAQEWSAQEELIDFAAMPATRLAFTAIDRSGGVHAALVQGVAKEAAADALCYPAEGPRGLVERQAEQWGRWRDWARAELGLVFEPAVGLLHRAQPSATLDQVERLAGELDDFNLTALVFAAALYGSAILALAVQRGALDAVEAFELSRLEEAYQAEQWGLDSEAEARNHHLRAEAAMVGAWFAALRA